jgi:hypothetical protein
MYDRPETARIGKHGATRTSARHYFSALSHAATGVAGI